MATSCWSAQNISEMFSEVEIRWESWPGHPIDMLVLEEVINNTNSVGMGIVILEYSTTMFYSLNWWECKRLKNMPVNNAYQIIFETILEYFVLHITLIILSTCDILEALSGWSASMNSAITKWHCEPGLCQQCHGLMLVDLCQMTSRPTKISTAINFFCKTKAYCRACCQNTQLKHMS